MRPYFGLRSYQDAGVHYDGQIGSEPTPAEFLDALLAATREMVRVLKPSGSIFVNLGDKYAGSDGTKGGTSNSTLTSPANGRPRDMRQGTFDGGGRRAPGRPKSLMGMPWRYAIRCIDQLGLILRAEIIWSKPNGLPESVTDRVRRSHEQWFHFTVQPRYFAAIDEIREAYAPDTAARYATGYHFGNAKHVAQNQHNNGPMRSMATDNGPTSTNPLGKLPGSVWTIPSQPLEVPPELGIDHFAAYPMEWPRRIIQGWTPSGICAECGEGRRPIAAGGDYDPAILARRGMASERYSLSVQTGKPSIKHQVNLSGPEKQRHRDPYRITGYICGCTPYTDHPGIGGSNRRADNPYGTHGREQGVYSNKAGEYERVGPWREYHFDRWTPAPTRPSVILDPFGGTGTTALVAKALGRTGISIDLSADYCRLAQWRCNDPRQLATALQIEKPEPISPDQLSLFGEPA